MKGAKVEVNRSRQGAAPGGSTRPGPVAAECTAGPMGPAQGCLGDDSLKSFLLARLARTEAGRGGKP